MLSLKWIDDSALFSLVQGFFKSGVRVVYFQKNFPQDCTPEGGVQMPELKNGSNGSFDVATFLTKNH